MAEEEKVVKKVDVIKPLVSMAKMDINELKIFTRRLSDYLKGPDVVAIRICECCVDVNIT